MQAKIKNLDDTIVALATPYGVGGVCIIRISGNLSLVILKELTKKSKFTPRYATLCDIYDMDNQVIDQAIAISFPTPNSFTGEDIVEIHAHGGIGIAEVILNEVMGKKARMAYPGEFTKRAYLNGKLDLTKAEAISRIVKARSKDSIKILSKHIKGELESYLYKLREDIIEALAFVEVNIDYAHEDLPTDLIHTIIHKINKIKDKFDESLRKSKENDALLNGFKLTIIGKPNVGKSSLLNSLLNKKRAIISEIEGTTRDTIEEDLNIGSHIVKLVDTAGIRKTESRVESMGIQRAIDSLSTSNIIIAMFDSSKKLNSSDKEMLNILKKHTDRKIIYVVNKIDLENRLERSSIANLNPIYIDCNKPSNLEKILENIELYLNRKNETSHVMLITKRQIQAIKDAKGALSGSLELLKNGEYELFAFWLNDAINHISSITRPLNREEIIDKLFSNFCLGK